MENSCRLSILDYHSVCKDGLLPLYYVTFSLNLRLNLSWEANSWGKDSKLTPVNADCSHSEGSLYSGQSICCTEHNIISRHVSMRAQSPPVAQFNRNKWRPFRNTVWGCAGGPHWGTRMLQDKNFCTFMCGLHDIEQIWMDYFETVVTWKGITGARTLLPFYFCSSRSNETWIERKQIGSLMTCSGSFCLNNYAVKANNNNLNVIRSVLGIIVSLRDRMKAQYYTYMLLQYILDFKLQG